MDAVKVIILRWATFIAGLFAVEVNELLAIFITFCVLVVTDTATGIWASMVEGYTVESYKARWTFSKLLSYFGTFALTAMIGVCIDQQEAFTYVLKAEIMIGLWVEALSVSENMERIFPENPLWKWIHSILDADIVKKFIGLTGFFKETNEDDRRKDEEK